MDNPHISSMTLQELSDWCWKNNNGLFDTGEFPAVDELDDDEEIAAREEYEAMADEIVMNNAIGPCGSTDDSAD